MNSKDINFVRCLKCQKILQCSRYDTKALLQHIRDDHPEIEIVHNGKKGAAASKNGNKIKSKDTRKMEDNNKSTAIDATLEGRGDEKATQQSGDGNVVSTNISHQYNNDSNKEEIIQRLKGKSNGMSYETINKEQQGPSMDVGETKQPYYMAENDLTQSSGKSELSTKYPDLKISEFCPQDANAKVIYTRRYKIKTPSTTTTTTTATTTPRTPRKRHLYRTSIEKWQPANGTIYCPKCGCNKRPLVKTKIQHFTQNEWLACCLFSCWPLCFLPWLLPSQEVEYLYCSNCRNFLGIYDHNSNCIKPNRDYVNDVRRLNIKLNNSAENSEALTTNLTEKSKRLPSLVIDGKELHPKMVARLQRYRNGGSLAALNLKALTNDEFHSEHDGDYIDSFRNGIPAKKAPSVGSRAYRKDFM